MENLEKFENFKNDDLKTTIIKYIKDNYSEDYITQQIEESIYNYIDDDWENDGEYESEYEWYQDYGRGEAEADVRMEIEQDVLKHFFGGIGYLESYDEYHKVIGEQLWDTIYDIFPILNV